MVNLAAITLSTPIHSLMPEIEASWESDEMLKAKITEIGNNGEDKEGIFTWKGMCYEGKEGL